jgi:hypothetical protein
MPQALLIAAGGGGDVIAAAAIAHALGLNPQDTIIATLAWERLLVDPEPGPRCPADFTGLSSLGQQTVEIVDTTQPKRPGTSTLPRLRAELGIRLALLDPRHGAVGLAEQLGDLVALLTGPGRVYLVDVGGDVLATGAEHGLKSPLADALMLAACAHLGTTAEVYVAGPGLDGELTQPEVRARFRALGATRALDLSERAATKALGVLEWHPSEATALLVAAARGLEGTAEIRDAGTQIRLSPQGACVWAIPCLTATDSSLAASIFDTKSFAEAEEALGRLIGQTELEYERHKAHAHSPAHEGTSIKVDSDVMDRVHQVEADAVARGSDYITFRRLAEAAGAARAHQDLRDQLIRRSPGRHHAPLWVVTA